MGFLYGPSGCGKSSLIKAGLLPRLPLTVISIYIEATATTTESQMIRSLRQRFPEFSEQQTLSEMLTALRQARETIRGEKVLIVIDQFEQWLHQRRLSNDVRRQELIEALRQCDGEHLQALILVRDDFWMATTRFARELEVPLVDGVSMNAVELFPLRHAMTVLIEFGRAFGCIASSLRDIPARAIGVRRAGRGVSLPKTARSTSMRLVVFAEMMKEKP